MTRKIKKIAEEEEEIGLVEYFSPISLTSSSDSKLIDRGIILINNEISKNSLNDAYQKILSLHFNPDFKDEIQIILNSPGGYTDGGWAFIDLLNFVKNPVRTVATGEIASMATYIFIAGDHRVMSPNTTAMIHQFSSGTSGTYGDLVAFRKFEQLEQERAINHLIRNSKYNNGKSITEKLLLSNDNYLSPQEMLAHGLCDEVLKIRPRNGKQKKQQI